VLQNYKQKLFFPRTVRDSQLAENLVVVKSQQAFRIRGLELRYLMLLSTTVQIYCGG